MNPMTTADLLALPPTVDLITAARALGCGRTLAYDLARRGQFPCRILRLGTRYLVPTAELLRTLGIGDGQAQEHFPRRLG
jgi:predicted DNA-binding transcriptional regulator AlpA